ncbi:hypothetical protein NYY75_18495, partial [Acinetobacter baumannii]|nr:hypothetical protein [Acinetobacter baumannii]
YFGAGAVGGAVLHPVGGQGRADRAVAVCGPGDHNAARLPSLNAKAGYAGRLHENSTHRNPNPAPWPGGGTGRGQWCA